MIIRPDKKPLDIKVYYNAHFGEGWLHIRQSPRLDEDALEVMIGERRGNTTIRQGCMIDPEDALRIANALMQWAAKPRLAKATANGVQVQ